MHAYCSLLYKLWIALYYLQPTQSSALLALYNTTHPPFIKLLIENQAVFYSITYYIVLPHYLQCVNS